MADEQWRNAKWKIEAKQDGTFSPDDMANALLIDIRGLLRQIRGMLLFFTVLATISLLFSIFTIVTTFSR